MSLQLKMLNFFDVALYPNAIIEVPNNFEYFTIQINTYILYI